MFIIHKPGQGYWTRLMSLIGGGALAAAGAMWAWAKLGAVDIPTRLWTFAIANTSGDLPGAGQAVTILGRDGSSVGTGIVEQASATHVALTGVTADSVRDLTGLSTQAGFQAIVNGVPIEDKLFQAEYLQGGVAALILLIGGAFVYYFCYANRKSSDFLIATEGEMKKVNWSTRREIFGSTWVVIVISLIIAGVLFFADFLFSQFFSLIKVIEMA
ncbi:MAG: preprotein translocase subunit SecE [Phycisphaerales bacterium]|nr:preprotein translocase subunit SecE [Phycisphaerales bacterium]